MSYSSKFVHSYFVNCEPQISNSFAQSHSTDKVIHIPIGSQIWWQRGELLKLHFQNFSHNVDNQNIDMSLTIYKTLNIHVFLKKMSRHMYSVFTIPNYLTNKIEKTKIVLTMIYFILRG